MPEGSSEQVKGGQPGPMRAQIMRRAHGNEVSPRSSPEFSVQLGPSEDNQGQVQGSD